MICFAISTEEFRDFSLSHPEYAALFTHYKNDQTESPSADSTPVQKHVQLEAKA